LKEIGAKIAELTSKIEEEADDDDDDSSSIEN
jgi:hypothetical protein